MAQRGDDQNGPRELSTGWRIRRTRVRDPLSTPIPYFGAGYRGADQVRLEELVAQGDLILQKSSRSERARIDPHVHKNARAIPKRDRRSPFEMTEKRIFPFRLPHQRDARRRSDGEKTSPHSSG